MAVEELKKEKAAYTKKYLDDLSVLENFNWMYDKRYANTKCVRCTVLIVCVKQKND